MFWRKKKSKPVYLPVIYDEPDPKSKKPVAAFNWAAAIPWILTVAALVYSIISGKIAQKWKHSEFVSAQFREFNQRPSVIFMNKILEYKARNHVFPDSPALYLNQGEVSDALTGDVDKDTKMRIRDLADDYLTQLGQFYRYYKAGLMDYEDIDANLHYYLAMAYPGLIEGSYQAALNKSIDSLTHLENVDEEVDRKVDSLFLIVERLRLPHSLQKFISSYKYRDVQMLFCLFHYNLTDSSSTRCSAGSEYYKDSVMRRESWYEQIVN